MYLGPALNSDALPFFILGGCAVIGGLLSLVLPETLGTPLMLSLDELDGLSERTKPLLKWWNKKELNESLERNIKAREEKIKAGR